MTTRKFEHPVRVGSDIYIERPDGTRVKPDILEAAQLLAEWAAVFKGAFVYQKTREG